MRNLLYNSQSMCTTCLFLALMALFPRPVQASCPDANPVTTKCALVSRLHAASHGNGDVIVIGSGASIDLSGEENLPLYANVTLIGNRSETTVGPLLYTNTIDHVHSLFRVMGDSVHVTGLRLRGPSNSTDEDLPGVTGIESRGRHEYLEIDNNEIYSWTASGVSIAFYSIEDTNYPEYLDECGEFTDPTYAAMESYKDKRDRVHIYHNYIHDNLRKNLGYGISVGRFGYALIEKNVFNYNRHAVAGTGSYKSGYEFRNNLVMPGARQYNANYTHAVDMHRGDVPAKGDTCGPAGEFIDIHHNAFQYGGVQDQPIWPDDVKPAFHLRGPASDIALFRNNAYLGDLDDAIKICGTTSVGALFRQFISLECSGTVHLAQPGESSNANKEHVNSLNEYGFGDFNGDARTDVLMTTGQGWYFSSRGRQPFQWRAPSAVRMHGMKFGDFDGDGATDVFWISSDGVWRVAYSAQGPWVPINYGNVTIDDVHLVDMDNDGITDVFYSDPDDDDKFKISRGGVVGWDGSGLGSLPQSPYGFSDGIRFGDFNGDGEADVFTIMTIGPNC